MVGRAIGWVATRVRQFLCKHDYIRGNRPETLTLALRCQKCGHESPGIDIGEPRFRRTYEGDGRMA